MKEILQYIAASPSAEHGGFHENTIAAAKWALQEIADLQQWVNDCQSGMFVNCVYCGHRYGPREDTPVAMADVLRQHIEQCPKHPLSAAKAEIDRLRAALLCEDCNGTGWMYCGVADTSTPCRNCAAYEIRKAARAAGGWK